MTLTAPLPPQTEGCTGRPRGSQRVLALASPIVVETMIIVKRKEKTGQRVEELGCWPTGQNRRGPAQDSLF
jgi:hypothetical protein